MRFAPKPPHWSLPPRLFQAQLVQTWELQLVHDEPASSLPMESWHVVSAWDEKRGKIGRRRWYPNSKEVCIYKLDINYHLFFAQAVWQSTKVYFQRTKVYFCNLKVYFRSTKLYILWKYKSILSKYNRYFRSTKIYFQKYKSIRSKYKNIRSKYKSIQSTPVYFQNNYKSTLSK